MGRDEADAEANRGCRARRAICSRRELLERVAALGAMAPFTALAGSARAGSALAGSTLAGHALAGAPDDAAKLRPQPGDRLTFAAGPRAGQLIAPADIVVGAPPCAAWPTLRAEIVPRDGSRLNLVRLLRLDPAVLTAKTTQSAADGIVAYAAMCSHAGCDVLGWDAQTLHLVCPCHGSQFDARDAAAVMQGPATRPLAQLPLQIVAGELVVAQGFTRQVGFKPL